MERLINGDPSLIAYRGRLLPDAMRRTRVTDEEVLAAVRAEGVDSLERVEAVVLETDGTFSVVRQTQGAADSALRDVPEARAA